MTLVYILIAIIAVFFAFQAVMVFKMRAKRGQAAPDLEGEFGRVVDSGGSSLFYFHSPGCRACLPMNPIIDKLKRDNSNVFKIDISSQMAVARKFGVMGTPATVLVRQGKIAEFLIGPQSEKKLIQLLSD